MQVYENRIKLAAEIVKATRAAVNDDFVVIFRLSMLDLVEGGSTWPEVIQLGQELEVRREPSTRSRHSQERCAMCQF